jgi:phosphoglycolate phosphatase-like HAD superfamily hydrolase
VERLVLWDIDRTLITAARIGAAFFARALEVTTGRTLTEMPAMGGQTDQALIRSVLALHDIPATPTLIERFYAELETAAHERRSELRTKGEALPGALAALTALGVNRGVVQTVVTGNIAPIARLKLEVLGAADFIDFEVGGYGSESTDRRVIVNLARERAAAKYGRAVAGERTFVIGDTQHDIAGALGSGVVAIGVATGGCTEAELRAAGAHVVLPSLVDTQAILDAVIGSDRPAVL